MRRLLAVPLLVAVLPTGCGGAPKSSPPAATAASPPSSCRSVAAPGSRAAQKLRPPAAPLTPSKHWTLTFATSCGTFVVLLEPRVSPRATASLVALARRGYFDGTVFHRIVPGFVIQGGDPTQTGAGGPGYTTVDPPSARTRYTTGVVAMAKAAGEPRGAAGSQFFVLTAPAPQLPPDYAVVGRVTAGLTVVERIGRLGDPATEQPTRTVEIVRVTAAAR